MTAADASGVAAQLAALRRSGEALGRRPLPDVHTALGRVLEVFRDGAGPARASLAGDLADRAGFSLPMVVEGLDRGLGIWSAEALASLVARELPDCRGSWARGFPVVFTSLAGAVPMPALLSLLSPLAVGSPVLAKTSAADPVTARHVARVVAEVDPALGDCIAVTSFSGTDEASVSAALSADCVVATGSDETIIAIRRRAPATTRLVTYGHRLSFAALGPDATAAATVADVAERLALDTALWDQLGCLSPIAVFALGERAGAQRLASELAGHLESAQARWPQGSVEAGAAAAIARERSDAELRAAAGQQVEIHASAGCEWTVVLEADARLRPAPLHRFVRIHPVPDREALLRAAAPLGPHLASVAVEGFGREEQALARDLAALGASRICRPGRMQSPPLGWHHEGRGVLTPLLRTSDYELQPAPGNG